MKRELGYIYREPQIILQRAAVWPPLCVCMCVFYIFYLPTFVGIQNVSVEAFFDVSSSRVNTPDFDVASFSELTSFTANECNKDMRHKRISVGFNQRQRRPLEQLCRLIGAKKVPQL